MRKLTLLLVAIAATFNVMATTASFNFSAQGYANAAVVTSGTIDANISWSATTGTNPPAYYDTGTGLRIYNGGTFVITPSNGKVITNITLTFAGNTYTFNTADANPTIWTGSTNAAQTFNVTRTCRLQTVEVTYQDPAANEVAMPVISPASRNKTAPFNVEITCTTEGAAIYYTLDDTEPTAASTLYQEGGFEVATTTTIKAIATKAAMTNSAVATATYTFPQQVADIAAFLALPLNTWAKIAGDITVVYHNGSNLYLQDASGYLLAYGNELSTITTVNGAIVKGASGNRGEYGGSPQVISPLAWDDSQTIGTPVAPSILTIANITNADHARYVKVENVRFKADGVLAKNNDSGTTEDDRNALLADETTTIRNNFKLDDYAVLAAKAYDITGFVSYYNGALNIYFTEIVEHIESGIGELKANAIEMYVQNGVLNVVAEGGIIEILDVLGRNVATVAANNGLTSISNLPANQMLIVKVGTKTGKIVIK